MDRRKHTLIYVEKDCITQYYSIDGKEARKLYSNTHRFLNGKTHVFARRSFKGATRLQFESATGGMKESIFSARVQKQSPKGDDRIFLCQVLAQSILGLGKNTKKFSLWIKKVE
jgi:hypothetical protein